MLFKKIPNKEFEMCIHQITQADWKFIMDNNPSKFVNSQNPVENVSFNDVQEFIKKLNDKKDGYKYRLPTEEEWEYCCRAGSTTNYCFGNDEKELEEYAWFDKNSENTTHEVMQKKPNVWGLYDMHGNVWEWCDSFYFPNQTDKGSYRVLRGGSWSYGGQYLRSAYRNGYQPSGRYSYIGFRLARTAYNPETLLPSNTLQELVDKANEILKYSKKMLEKYSNDVEYLHDNGTWKSASDLPPSVREYRIKSKKQFEYFKTKDGYKVQIIGDKLIIGCKDFDLEHAKKALTAFCNSEYVQDIVTDTYARRNGIFDGENCVSWEDADRILKQLEELE